MKHFYRFLALFMALCMIFPLSACLGEEAAETTEPPATSAVETTEEITETIAETEEVTQVAEKEISPIQRLRKANTLTKKYKSYVKTTALTIKVDGEEYSDIESVYAVNGEKFSETVLSEDEMISFSMYDGASYTVINTLMGEKGFIVPLDTNEKYKKIMGEDKVTSNKTMFDLAGNNNFEEGIASHNDGQYIISIDLSEDGKEAYYWKMKKVEGIEFQIDKGNIVAVIDVTGEIASVTFTIDIVAIDKESKEEFKISMTNDVTLSNVNEDIEIKAPGEYDYYDILDFDAFYIFYPKLLGYYSKVYDYGYDFGSQNSVTLILKETVKKNPKEQKFVYESMSRHVSDKGINLFLKKNLDGVESTTDYYYDAESGKTYSVENKGELRERHDIGGADLSDWVTELYFSGYRDDIYKKSNTFVGQSYPDVYRHFVAIEEEVAYEWLIKAAEQFGIKLEKEDIKLHGAYEYMMSNSKNVPFYEFLTSIWADVTIDGKEYRLEISEKIRCYSRDVNYIEVPAES